MIAGEHGRRSVSYRTTAPRLVTSESTLAVAVACLVATGLLYAVYVALFSVPFAG